MTKDYTDFRSANDSPGSVLAAKAHELYEKTARLSSEKPAAAEVARTRAAEYSTAATFLFSHEVQNGVTFVALDNDTLTEVARLEHEYRTETDPEFKAIHASILIDELTDLLGLEA